jgi:hypothetical protein
MPLVYQGKCFKMDVAVKVPRLQRLNALQLHGLRTEIAIMRYPHTSTTQATHHLLR